MNVANDALTKVSPATAAARANFNELMVSGYPKSFEEQFQKFETSAARPISDILSSQTLSFLSIRQRASISRFVAAQAIRTDAYRLGLRARRKQYDVGAALDTQLSDIELLANFIRRRKWALMVTSSDKPFYLGDNPVVLQDTEHPGRAGELGLDMDGVEVFMPLSPMCALYMLCPSIGGDIEDGYLDALRIVTANLGGIAIAKFDVEKALPIAQRTLESAGPLYRAITSGAALNVDADNVENLNYLQCAWASSGVFSNNSDFTFAKRVFRENPQYRSVLPVTLYRTSG